MRLYAQTGDIFLNITTLSASFHTLSDTFDIFHTQILKETFKSMYLREMSIAKVLVIQTPIFNNYTQSTKLTKSLKHF